MPFQAFSDFITDDVFPSYTKKLQTCADNADLMAWRVNLYRAVCKRLVVGEVEGSLPFIGSRTVVSDPTEHDSLKRAFNGLRTLSDLVQSINDKIESEKKDLNQQLEDIGIFNFNQTKLNQRPCGNGYAECLKKMLIQRAAKIAEN